MNNIKHSASYIKGYPRPQFVRESWLNLNGNWEFAFDSKNEGECGGYNKGFKSECDITVPYSYECEASGVGKAEMVENVWYSRSFELTAEQKKKRTVLHFEGVDYTAKVWVNGIFVGVHSGGYSRFSFDISYLATLGENLLVVKAEDSFDLSQPRGKQRWKNHNYGCWYEQTTGIWKTVWLEFTDRNAWLGSVKITPKIDEYAFEFEFESEFAGSGYELETLISFNGEMIKKATFLLDAEVLKATVLLESVLLDNQVCFWSPHDPIVYDMVFTIKKGGEIIDRVESYCGLREFNAEGATTQLNRYPYYQKLVLYQGYWEKTLLTAPNEEAIIKDIALIKELGYNGVRVHQKIEDERFLYYADIMGLLVWCEMPSPHSFSERGKTRFTAEWQEILKQSYNHPSLVTWVIYNESWGIREVAYNKAQQAYTEAMYKLTKAYDQMRPVISNDGWEHTLSDVLTLHNYEQNSEVLADYYKSLEAILCNRETRLPQHSPYAQGYAYGGQPIIMSEYGGCAFAEDVKDGWGYGTAVDSLEGFYIRFKALADCIKALPYCAGYCYTQFTDVRQEKNGLLTIDRKYKIDPARIRAINECHINTKNRNEF